MSNLTLSACCLATVIAGTGVAAHAAAFAWDDPHPTILKLTTHTPDNETLVITAGTQTQYTLYGDPADYPGNPCDYLDELNPSQVTNVPADQPTAKIEPGINYVNSYAITQRFGTQLLCFKSVEEITESNKGVIGTFVSGPFALVSSESGRYISATPNSWTLVYAAQ